MTAIFTESEYEIELSSVQGPAGAGLAAIANNTLLGNTSGSTATPVARTAQQMGVVSATQVQTFTAEQQEVGRENISAQLASANLDRLDGTVPQQQAALGIGQVEDVILITSFGESTTGGKALNTEAPTWQLAARTSLNFFNVNTSVFEALDIGTNNNLDHQDLNSTTHGPELELANACERGEFNRSIYYVQTGQGSSTVSQWDVGNGSGHWTKFLNRTNAAKAILAGKRVQHVVWMQIGQNDVSSTNQYTFKGALRGIISRIKTQLPGAKIIIATIPGNAVGKANYNARINELNDDPDVVVIDGDLPTYDTYHYDYRINRRIANRYIAAMRSILGLRSRPITLVAGTSSTLDEIEVQLNAQNAHARIAQTFDLTFDRDIVQFQLSGDGVLLALDSDVNEDNWGSGAAYHIAGFVSGALIYWSLANMGNINGSVTTTANAVYRFRKSGGDLHFEQRGDNGTWTAVHTATGLISSVYSARIRINATSGAGTARVWTDPY